MEKYDIELTQNNNKHAFPNIIHFFPGCDQHENTWRELNDDFVILKWDAESLQRIIKNTEILKDLHIDFSKDTLAIASAICYNFGGVVVTKPGQCVKKLQNLLGHLPTTLLAVFYITETHIDDSILISSPKIGAFTALFQYFSQAKSQRLPVSQVFHDFVKSSINVSNAKAIVCLHPNVKASLTKGINEIDTKIKNLLNTNLPESKYFHVVNPHVLSERLIPLLQSLGKCASANATHTHQVQVGILIIDRKDFDMDAPIPAAIEAVLAFQNVNLSDDAIVIVSHSPEGGIGLDMMIAPQLYHLKAKEIYRTDHVAWKINTN